MFGSEILDVAIGLILVYLLMSLICTAIREGLEAWMKMRAVHLEQGIRELLRDPDGTGLAKALYEHPLVYSLYAGSYDPSKIKKSGQMPAHSNLPSYIPASNFARALLDIVARGLDPGKETGSNPTNTRLSLEGLRASVSCIQNPFVQRALLSALDTAQGDLTRAQANIEAWYDSAMDRISGWYKRRTQYLLFAMGLILTVAINVNTFSIADALSRDKALREALVLEAEVIARDTNREATLRQADLRQRYAELERLDLPVGWADGWPGPPREEAQGTWHYLRANAWEALFAPIFGWLVTALAITLGAPFWFDVLNKFMIVRSTVKPREKSPEEASEDRQPVHPLLQPGTWQRESRAVRADSPSLPASLHTPG